ncbi:hypothetical protein CAP39_01715 [Sphingomonas sp. IBVSS1]|nr:hypothetical protein CAP39_01715 [Sphingomonas sp. IBVSS1]
MCEHGEINFVKMAEDMQPQPDFGRFLQSVAERDVDLLLMEEFHVSPAFSAWFAQEIGIASPTIFDGAWHSLSDQDGETDLLLRVRVGSERIAILIENKIGAPSQQEQDKRYHLRGRRAAEAGRFERFVTAICAPQVYLDAMPDDTAYQHRIAYEAIRDWYAAGVDKRSEWRARVMSEAIDQGRRGYTMKVHAGKTAFHHAFWQFIQEGYPEFLMHEPGNKGAKSDWIRFKHRHFPKGVTLNYKIDRRRMDLEFARTASVDLLARRSSDWPVGAKVIATGKSAVISLAVPTCEMDRPLEEQVGAIQTVLAAARALVPLARMFNPD